LILSLLGGVDTNGQQGRAIDKLGLNYRYMSKLNSEIIMIGCNIYGQIGPMVREWGMEGTVNALSGCINFTSWSDLKPLAPTCCPYGDMVLPLFAASAIVTALDCRKRIGKVQYIDTSMFEICVHSMSPAFLDWQANARLQRHNGNRIAHAALQLCYHVSGKTAVALSQYLSTRNGRYFAMSSVTPHGCRSLGSPHWRRESNMRMNRKN
jgi:crotonobetainyl-CoA:carnitine CoA-transferase CaiB-like acyl-CoA transferase